VIHGYRQSCSLGPLPPRTPARADPQVPREPDLGPARWGKIGAFYFYLQGSNDEPAFGFFDIEFSLQRLAGGAARVEIYAIADGYQKSGASGAEHPLVIALKRGDEVVARLDWTFPDILDGCADPISFARDIRGAVVWDRVDRIELFAAGE
jgi:hypothetical protein